MPCDAVDDNDEIVPAPDPSLLGAKYSDVILEDPNGWDDLELNWIVANKLNDDDNSFDL